MGEVMKKFIDCLNDNQSFDARVAGSAAFSFWSPGDRIPALGKWFLIGIATNSVLDLLLLDELELEVLQSPDPGKTIALFRVTDCQTPEDLDRYIPEIHREFQTPAVGLWYQGVLTFQASGQPARDLVSHHYSIAHRVSKFIEQYYKDLNFRYHENLKRESL